GTPWALVVKNGSKIFCTPPAWPGVSGRGSPLRSATRSATERSWLIAAHYRRWRGGPAAASGSSVSAGAAPWWAADAWRRLRAWRGAALRTWGAPCASRRVADGLTGSGWRRDAGWTSRYAAGAWPGGTCASTVGRMQAYAVSTIGTRTLTTCCAVVIDKRGMEDST